MVTDHTEACDAVRKGGWPLMRHLRTAQQQAVLDCPHPSHDSVRFLFQDRPHPNPYMP